MTNAIKVLLQKQTGFLQLYLQYLICNRNFVCVNFIATFFNNILVIIYLRLGTA
jgi:hypothetical protein